MFSIQITATDRKAVIAALKKAKVDFTLEAVTEIKQIGAQDPEIASRIYELAATGLVYRKVAAQTGVSYATVLRVVQNPSHYGIEKPPIRRIVKNL